jgi:hypothetical protein
MAALMKHSNNNRPGCNNEINRVGKPLKKGAPHTASNLRELKWILRDAFHEGIES